MFEIAFVPELAVGMVSRPRAVLLFIVVKAAASARVAGFVEPFPLANYLSVFVAARGLHLAVIEKILPIA